MLGSEISLTQTQTVRRFSQPAHPLVVIYLVEVLLPLLNDSFRLLACLQFETSRVTSLTTLLILNDWFYI